MPIQLHAKLNAFRRSPKGFYITLEIGPDSDWSELAAADLGQAFGVAMVPYDPETGKRVDAGPGAADGSTAAPTPVNSGVSSGKPRQPFHQMSRAQQAGILCADLGFKLWLSSKMDRSFNGNDAAEYVRQHCGVTSRSELSENREAGKKWDQLVTDFYQATGRMAEAR